METIRKPTYRIFYNGNNITEDLTLEVIALNYTDKVKGESDEISFTVSDANGLWRNQWKPVKGDLIQVWMGYINQMFPAGTFEVDEIQIMGPPDRVEIRAAAALASKNIRTKKSYSHEGKTLKQIAEKVALDHGLTLEGEINSNFVIKKAAQFRKTDLSFLAELAEKYGYVFNIRNDKLIFSSIYDLESSDSSLFIHRSRLSSYSITDKTVEVFKTAQVKFFNPDQSEKIEATNDDFIIAPGADDKIIYANVDSQIQADEIAKAAIHKSSTSQNVGNFSIEGDPRILSGINVELGGLGQYSGKYHILDSSHSISPSGAYKTSFKAKKIGEISNNKWQ